MWNNILITGGSGLLGTHLQQHLPGRYPTHAAFDITTAQAALPCDLLVHVAAYTNVDRAQDERTACFTANVLGTLHLLALYPITPFVFISTEHVHAQGVYFASKRIGEELVKTLARRYLIIRTLFKPTPYPYPTAWIDQMTQGDGVDAIAPLIAREIQRWDGASKTVYVGTGRKSIYQLARKTRPDVRPTLVEDYHGAVARPKDYL